MINEALQEQTYSQKVKVKIKDELVSAVVEKCHFISKLSFDSLYFYATAKVDLRLTESDQLYRECQVRELIFYRYI